jgi:redox-sensitive bicupin YhaK (pirin superfamily)
MNRKDFLQKSALGFGALAATAGITAASQSEAEPQQHGFNHIPPSKPERMNNVIIHRADSRGKADHGWLRSFHTFSFAQYYNPERMQFGVLRVLNDDQVAPGMGFGTHPHDNMEIISIPLSGDLEHRDSMGNVSVIRENDIQVMSAGTGITHSEYNKNKDKSVSFLQIWVFPKTRNVKPRYDQITLDASKQQNRLEQVLSPNPNDQGVWIHQDAWFHLGRFEAGKGETYTLRKSGNGIYVFVLEGSLQIDDQLLNTRDGMGVTNTTTLQFTARENARVLVMEVPMERHA